MSPRLRKFNGFVALGLLAAAAVQWNDADGLRWGLLYGSAAGAALQADRWLGDWIVPAVCGAAAWIWFALVAPQAAGLAPAEMFASMEAGGAQVEAAREAGGLLIVGSWMLVLLWCREES